MITRCGALAAILAGCLVLGACDADTPSESTVDQAGQQFGQLMLRPDIDQITAHYQQMYGELRQQLSATFPTVGAWTQESEVTTAACGAPFAAVDADRPDDAVTRSVGNWGTAGPLSDDQWNGALGIVTAIVQRYGFDTPAQVMTDKPGAHDVTFHDSYGAQLTFGTGNTAGFTSETGCHLTAPAKQRGHLSPATTP
jgi:hypothetical protein